MKSIFVIVGVVAVLLVLITSGVMGGGVCLRHMGCAYSQNGSFKIDNSSAVQISAGTNTTSTPASPAVLTTP